MFLSLSVSFDVEIMSPHHSDQMSRRSQVSQRCLPLPIIVFCWSVDHSS